MRLRWLVAASVLWLGLDVGCGQGVTGYVRERDGSIARRRLDLWELVVARRAQVDLPCDFEEVVVSRVRGTQRLTAEGCGRAVTYACVEGPRAPLCNLETVGREPARPDVAPLALGPVQSIVAISPATATPPGSPRRGVRSELADPRGPDRE